MNKKLVVSRTDKQFLGVCGGLSQYFGMKSDNIRLAFIIGAFLGGTSIALYLLLALVMAD